MAAGGAINWMSPMIPPTIRRPWRVFNEDVEDKLWLARAALEAVKERGAQAAFASLPEEVQRTYAEVSLMELSAYVCWRNHWGFIDEAAWHALHCDDKARWIPEDHRTVLMADAIWAPLLVDGPPACDFASTLPADGARGDVKGKGGRSVKGKGGRSVTAKAKVAKGAKPEYCCELCDWKGQNLNRHYDKDHPTEVTSGAVKKRLRGAAGHATTCRPFLIYQSTRLHCLIYQAALSNLPSSMSNGAW